MQKSDLSKIESTVSSMEDRSKKLLAENIKDVKALKVLLSEATSLQESLTNDLKDILLSNMPTIEEKPESSERINILKEYFHILDNYSGTNVFYDLCTLLYALEYPEDLGEYNTILRKLFSLFESYEMPLTPNDFNVSSPVKEYIIRFFEVREKEDYLLLMKDKLDQLYWTSHDLLNDILLNIKIIIFVKKEGIAEFLKKKKEKYVEDNKIDESFARKELNDLILKKSIDDSQNPINILYAIKNGEIDADSLDKDSSLYKDSVTKFISEEKYETCNKIDFINNIIQLKENLMEYKYYEKFKYLISIVSEIADKKEEYKTVYTTKSNDLKKELDNKNKIYSELSKVTIERGRLTRRKSSLFFGEKKKQKKLDVLAKKIDELDTSLNASISLIRDGFVDYDLCLFREKVSTIISKTYTILDDFLLFKNSVYVLNDSINKYELNLSKEERKKICDDFHALITSSTIQIINTFDFVKKDDVALRIADRYKLIDINIELDEDNIDDYIDSCQVIINSNNASIAKLNPVVVKYINKYIIKNN